MFKYLKRLIRPIIAALLILTLVEIAAQVYFHWFLPPDRFQFRASNPLAYAQSPYYNAAFIAEQDQAENWWTLTDDGLLERSDFHGQYYNVISNFRRTTDQPSIRRHVVWALGASTLYDGEVPDAYTIASYLQRDIGEAYTVENRGMQSIDAAKEVHILKSLPVQAGDVVIMYDGVIDTLGTYYNATNRFHEQPNFCSFALSQLNELASIHAICFDTEYPLVMPTAEEIHEAYMSYVKAIDDAKSWSATHGVMFYHFLQPQIFSRSLSTYEQSLVDNWRLTERGIGPIFEKAWPVFEKIPNTVDLTHVIDPLRASGTEVYLDCWHTNERANAVIARAIYDTIWPRF